MSALSEQECQNKLLNNKDVNISIAVENKVYRHQMNIGKAV